MDFTVSPNSSVAQWNLTQVSNVSSSQDWIGRLRNVCEIGFTLPITCFGLLGNLFAFIVLCHHNPRTTTRVLLQTIAVTDWSVLFCSLVLRSLRYVVPGYERTSFFLQAFRWMYPCTYIFRFGGSWMTVLLTVDRFIAVRYPLHAQRLCTLRRTYILMLTTTVCTILFSLPRFFEFHLISEGGHHGVVQSPLLTHRQYTVVYRIVAYLLLIYLVPMILIVTLNYILLCTLREARKRRKELVESNCPSAQNLLNRLQNPLLPSPSVTSGQQAHTNHNSITVMVITVVLTSIICNSTAMVAHVLWSLNLSFPEISHIEKPRRAISSISNVLVTTNSAINFVIYCLCSRNFRHVCMQTFSRMTSCMHTCIMTNALHRTSTTVASTISLRQLSNVAPLLRNNE